MTCPRDGDNPWKRGLIPDALAGVRGLARKGFWVPKGPSAALGGARVLSGSWWGNGLPSLRRVGGLRGWPPAWGLRHGPDTYGWQQWGIVGNGRKPDPATPREG